MQRFPTSLACMLCLGLNACLPAATGAVNHSTAVSQTYEGVHLSEALQKVNDGEGKLEDLLHWAIGKSCTAVSPCYSCQPHGNLGPSNVQHVAEHSDPTQLKQQAEDLESDSTKLSERQQEIQQVLQPLQQAAVI